MYKQRHNEVLMTRVAKRLKALREAKGITQAEAYRLTGIHVGRIESGNANVTVSTFSELCKFYRITFEEFFAGIENNP